MDLEQTIIPQVDSVSEANGQDTITSASFAHQQNGSARDSGGDASAGAQPAPFELTASAQGDPVSVSSDQAKKP